MSSPKPIMLLVLDGWGVSSEIEGNAIMKAHTPTWDHLMLKAPHTLLSGCGEDVGLPEGQMGNSEVGHLTMGAGRVIYQDLSRIAKAIEEGTFFNNGILKDVFLNAKASGKTVHILGLLSPGGVHSHEDHLFACIKMAKDLGVKRILLHVFLDGRDTPPQSAKASLQKLEDVISVYSDVHIATVSGRYYAMDRDKRWERVKLAYDAIVYGVAPYTATSSMEALLNAYQRNENDEFVKPTCILYEGNAFIVEANDNLVYMNFRSDRARALTQAFCLPDFNGFDKGNPPSFNQIVTLTEYDQTFPVKVAFPPQKHSNVLGEYLQNQHFTQLHLAETEKYAHVTFFFNGGVETPYKGEERILISSPHVATYDLKPEMSAVEITDVLVNAILNQQYDFIVCNYANADMVGHTGNFDATVKAIETLDICLKRIIDALHKVGGEALITSDHGNAECMIDFDNHQSHTAHTMSKVPLVYVGKRNLQFTSKGALSDIAPTLLALMNLTVPKEMTGQSLIREDNHGSTYSN